MRKTLFSVFVVSLPFIAITGCVKHPVVEKYNPNDFISLNRIVTKKVAVHEPTRKVNATFNIGNDPAVIKAYRKFSKTGQANTIQANGFVTFPYDAYSHPIVSCEPLHLCVVQLEQQEKINNIALGDSAHWLVSSALVGTSKEGSYQIAIKPKAYDMATDMVITTNKRTYNIGLVSKHGEQTHVVNFYYPQESLTQAIQLAYQHENSRYQDEIIDSHVAVDVNHLNFDYQLRGNHPTWQPLQVFDDGNKTYIRMPRIAAHVDLPVLYIVRHHDKELVNYRYKRPFYIIDTLFKKAVLVSGKGHHQEKVMMVNQHLA